MSIQIYFGVPGSGKTTHAARVVYKNLKKGIPTFSNVDIRGAIVYSANDDLGQYQIENADLIIDEAGIEFNNRATKTFPKHLIQWFKLYRHYGIRNLYVYSQSYEDMDITLRRLCDQIFVVRKSLIPFLFVTKRIKVKIGIDDESHQIIDQYFFQPLGFRHFFGPAYWNMFDSWAAPPLPDKAWTLRGFPDISLDKSALVRLWHVLRREKSLFGKLIRLFTKHKTFAVPAVAESPALAPVSNLDSFSLFDSSDDRD